MQEQTIAKEGGCSDSCFLGSEFSSGLEREREREIKGEAVVCEHKEDRLLFRVEFKRE